MADIRINALATTATTPASDDYLALDGTAQGTRKILATNIANNVTDVILGSSGPSVKSTLSARAPRQGLVYDGTTNSSATLTSAIGTSDFTVSVPVTVPASNPSGARGIFSIGNFGNAQSFCVYIGTGGALDIVLFGATGGDYRASGVNGFVSANAGKTGLLTITRSSTTLTVYFNGVSQTLVAPTIGGVDPTWAGTLTSTSVRHGNMSTILYFYVGYVGDLDIYNRALSASEVVALYEAGAPAGADYTSPAAGVSTAFSGSTWSSDGTATLTNLTAATVSWSDTNTGYVYSLATNLRAVKVGTRVRATFTIANLTGTVTANIATLGTGGTSSATINVANGSNVTLEGIAGTSGAALILNWSAASSGDLTAAAFVCQGLLLAPDAAQAGGGLVWYDTSGNAANITLPASGVSWNVPSSRVLGGNWSATGNFLIGTSTASGVLTINKAASDTLSAANAAAFIGQPDTFQVGLLMQQTLSAPYSFALQVTRPNGAAQFPLTLNPSGGNVLIGTTTDGGQKLQVNGTAAISGGIVGTTTNDSAAAGIVGQYAETSTVYGSRITLTTDTVANVASVSLTSGDWDVSGNVELEMSGVTSTDKRSGISTTSASLTNNPDTCGAIDLPTTTLTGYLTIPTPTVRISIASTTTVYLPTKVTFSAGTTKAWGIIRARRVR